MGHRRGGVHSATVGVGWAWLEDGEEGQGTNGVDQGSCKRRAHPDLGDWRLRAAGGGFLARSHG